MPSTRDPILSLEPSNLLEPLDLADRDVTSATSSARAQSAAAAISRPDASRAERSPLSWAVDSHPVRKAALSPPIERESRWRLKSALLVMGALACVATGTALPQLAELPFGDAQPSQQAKSAQEQRKESIRRTIAETTSRPAPVAKQPASVADAPAKSEESKAAESKPSEPTTNGSNQSVAVTAGTQPAAANQLAPAPTQAPPQEAAAGPAAGTARAVVPDRNSDGTTTASRPAGASPAKSRAAPQSIWDLDQRPQQSVNRRATQRDTADQQAAADNNGQSTRSSDRNSSDRNWDRDRRQDQDSNRTSSRRRDRSGDNGQTARYGDSRQEQELSRASSGRRDRNEDYSRGEDRRVFGRAPREDDRVMGAGPRYEEGPSIPIFGPLFGGR